MSRALKNSYSWSFSRYNLFNFCELAYFFHYYGSWNGWDPYAPKQTKKSYRLKHLMTKELWLNCIIRKSLVNAINRTSPSRNSLYEEFESQSRKTLSHDINSLYEEKWKENPKNICLDEIYYREKNIEETVHWIKRQTCSRIKILQESKLFHELSVIPFPAFINIGGLPLSFTLNSTRIWCSPDLIWNSNGLLNILNLDNGPSWPFLAGLNQLYADQNYSHVRIACHTLFIKKDISFSVYGIRSPKEIMGIIAESSREMQSRLTINQKAYIENFSGTGEQKKCQTCRFKAICQYYRHPGGLTVASRG